MPKDIGPGLKELLDNAHHKYTHGLRIETECLETGTSENGDLHRYKATVTGVRVVVINEQEHPTEEIFNGHGDASPNEAGAKRGTPSHDTPGRMAESRAVVRGLRFATNVGETAAEEMPYSEDEPKNVNKTQEQKTGNKMSEPQERFLTKLVESKLGGDWEEFEKEFTHPMELTVQEASAAINDLKERDDG